MDSSEQIKKQLHSLIDASRDEARLGIVYQILNQAQVKLNTRIQLTDQQGSELMESYRESFDESNLIDLELLKERHSKWLKSSIAFF